MKTYLRLWVRQLRCEQWLKNAFIVAPLVFSRELTRLSSIQAVALTVVSFSLGASGLYCLNDLNDLAHDRLHPAKKLRPLAAGLLTRLSTALASALLISVSLVLARLVGPSILRWLVLYVVTVSTYTTVLKRVAILDVIVLSIGYVIRVEAGASAVGITATPWILTVTFFLALVLSFGKRRGEFITLSENAAAFRKVLGAYTLPVLDDLIIVSVASTAITYSLYVVESPAAAESSMNLICTLPFVVFGLFRYLYLLHSGSDTDPTNLFLKDAALLLAVLLWGLTVLLILYLPGRLLSVFVG